MHDKRQVSREKGEQVRADERWPDRSLPCRSFSFPVNTESNSWRPVRKETLFVVGVDSLLCGATVSFRMLKKPFSRLPKISKRRSTRKRSVPMFDLDVHLWISSRERIRPAIKWCPEGSNRSRRETRSRATRFGLDVLSSEVNVTSLVGAAYWTSSRCRSILDCVHPSRSFLGYLFFFVFFLWNNPTQATWPLSHFRDDEQIRLALITRMLFRSATLKQERNVPQRNDLSLSIDEKTFFLEDWTSSRHERECQQFDCVLERARLKASPTEEWLIFPSPTHVRRLSVVSLSLGQCVNIKYTFIDVCERTTREREFLSPLLSRRFDYSTFFQTLSVCLYFICPVVTFVRDIETQMQTKKKKTKKKMYLCACVFISPFDDEEERPRRKTNGKYKVNKKMNARSRRVRRERKKDDNVFDRCEERWTLSLCAVEMHRWTSQLDDSHCALLIDFPPSLDRSLLTGEIRTMRYRWCVSLLGSLVSVDLMISLRSAVHFFVFAQLIMSDFNLFSSKTDIKKLLFSTEKFKFDEQCSSDSWQDLPAHTPSLFLPTLIDRHDPPSSALETVDDPGWETLDDYATVSIPVDLQDRTVTTYGRFDRRGHWLLLPPVPPAEETAPVSLDPPRPSR